MFDPQKAYDHSYAPDLNALAAEAATWGLPPASADTERVMLVVVDAQYDFSFPEGALYVAGRSGTGAMDANRNLAAFVLANAHRLTRIDCSMDAHVAHAVFHPAAHVDRDGKHPAPYTLLSAERYERGQYSASGEAASALGVGRDWLTRHWTYYCEQLEAAGKYQLMVWPYHCVQGTRGQVLAGVVQEAWFAHKVARGAANDLVIKGVSPFTEWYSIFGAEVTAFEDGKPITGAALNEAYIRELLAFDKVIFAGLASSHCVKASLEHLSGWIRQNDPDLARKVYILRDCMAPVVAPGADYTDEAERALAGFAEAGMHVITSDVPIGDWPR